MIDTLFLFLFIAFIVVFIINWVIFIRPNPDRMPFDFQTIKKSNLSKAMLISTAIFGLIFAYALLFTSYSNWLILLIIIGAFIIVSYGSTMKKNWSLIAWGIMAIAALEGIFLEIDRSKLSLLGLIGLIMVAIILHLYNKEKAEWV